LENTPWIRSLPAVVDTLALPLSVLVPRLMVKVIVDPTTVPFIASTPIGDMIVAVNAPVERFSLLTSMGSEESDEAKPTREL